MAHFYNNPKSEQELVDIVGKDNPLAKDINKQEDEHAKYENFEAVDRLVSAARSLYCQDDMKWDEMITSLCDALDSLKGKEEELQKIDEEAQADEDSTPEED